MMGKAKPLEPLPPEQKALVAELADQGEAIAQRTRQAMLAMFQRCLGQCRACQEERDQLREQVRSWTETAASLKCEGSLHVKESPMSAKKKLTGLFRDQPETPEGKYLVKRRDGTVVEWPSFVLGARDPHAAAVLRAYADSIEAAGTAELGFVASLRSLADRFDAYRAQHGEGDPEMGAHRVDDPDTIAAMRQGYSS